MLVLTRKRNEVILLQHEGGGVLARVMVVDILGHQVRIGIEAPSNIIVDREEVSESKRRGEQV